MSTIQELIGMKIKAVEAGLKAVQNVDRALAELGLVSYMATQMGQLAHDAEAVADKVEKANGKIHPIKAKAKARKSPKGGYWSNLTKAERSAEMQRRQVKRYQREKAQTVEEQHSGSFGVNPSSAGDPDAFAG